MEYQEVKDSTQVDADTVSGKSYLAEQAQVAKENKQAAKAAKAAQRISDEQTLSHNGNAYGQGTGEDMERGMP
jgi:hypothetical protein